MRAKLSSEGFVIFLGSTWLCAHVAWYMYNTKAYFDLVCTTEIQYSLLVVHVRFDKETVEIGITQDISLRLLTQCSECYCHYLGGYVATKMFLQYLQMYIISYLILSLRMTMFLGVHGLESAISG